MPPPKENDPMEVYQGQEVRKSQKDVLLEFEKACGKPLPPLEQIRLNDYRNSFGFMVQSGYVVGLGLQFARLVPESIGQLTYLKYLSIPISSNPKLPENIINLQYLEELKFQYYNPMSGSHIMAKGGLPHLRPSPLILETKICQLNALKKLDISDNYKITELPECLADMPHLQEINITNCHYLSTIPKKIRDTFILQRERNNEFLIRKPITTESAKNISQNQDDSIPEIITYQGQQLVAEEAHVLMKLEELLLTPIPPLVEIKEISFGFTSERNHVLTLHFYRQRHLIRLPEEIENLQYLQQLIIYACIGFNSLPDSFGKLKSLRNLKIVNSPLDILPNSLGDLSNLQYLYISGEKIQTLPQSIGQLKNLKELTIYCMKLKAIPECIGDLASLQKLQISGSYTLKSLPESISKLTNLKELIIINFPELCSLPKGLASLPNLERFELMSCNKVAFDPLTIPITNKFYQDIPLTVEEKRVMLELEHLAKGPLVHINKEEDIRTIRRPSSGFFTAQDEHVTYLRFKTLPVVPDSIGTLTALQELHIGDRRVKSLPESIGQLNSLTYLSVKGSYEFRTLPESIGKLKRLEKLEIEECSKFDTIPESLQYLPSLKELIVKKCALKELPVQLIFINSLKTIDLSRNPIKSDIVYDKFKEELIKEEQAVNLLKLSIEGNEDPNIRVDSLETLEKIMLMSVHSPQLNQKYFKIFENCLITDDRGFARRIAANKIIKHFPKEGLESLKWAAENDTSLLVLKVLYNSSVTNEFLKFLKNTIMNRLSTIYNVVPEEAKIIFDLSITQGYGMTTYDHLSKVFHEIDMDKEFFKRYGSDSAKEVIFDKTNRGYYHKFYSAEYGHITALDLRNLGFENVPNTLKPLSKLQYLDLSCNKLKHLPDWLGNLPLKYLDVSHNFLSELPYNINHLFIPELNISHNYQLKPVSKEVMNYVKQKYMKEEVDEEEALVLAYLELKIGKILKKVKLSEKVKTYDKAHRYKLNEDGNIIGLYVHDFEDFWFKEIPEVVFSLMFLEELDFSDNFCIKTIPESIKALTSLKYLNLSNNMIGVIPSAMSFLKHLSTLKLNGNKIKIIPDFIGDLKKLITLELSHNEIELIPPSLKRLLYLEYLGLIGNNISIITDFIDLLTNLKELYLGFNQIQEIPLELCQLNNLRILSIPGNHIKMIPDQIGKLTYLRRLYVMGNELKELPKKMDLLMKIKYIDVSDNHITFLHDSLAEIASLEHFDVSYNPIDSISPTINSIKGLVFKKYEPYY